MLTVMGILLAIVGGGILLLIICGLLGIVVGGASVLMDVLVFLISGGAFALLVGWLIWHFIVKKMINK